MFLQIWKPDDFANLYWLAKFNQFYMWQTFSPETQQITPLKEKEAPVNPSFGKLSHWRFCMRIFLHAKSQKTDKTLSTILRNSLSSKKKKKG